MKWQSIEANIPRLYAIAALRWFMLIMPILVLFYQDNGLSMTEVMLLQAIFSVMIVLVEIPSGYMSDVLGRRLTMIWGVVLGTLGFGVYCISYGFWGFLLSELLLGIGAAFISGTDSALLYDSLAQMGREKEYMKLEGRMLAMQSFSEGLAGIAGGLLAVISLRMPLYVEAALMLFTIPLALGIVEPAVEAFERRRASWADIMAIVRYALREHREIKWLILYSALVGTSTLSVVWFIQPYLQLVGLPLPYFGLAWAALQFSVALFSLIAWRVEAAVGRRIALISLIGLSSLAFALLSQFQVLWAALFIFLFYFVRGINNPVTQSYINALVSSDKRATVLSLRAFVSRLAFASLAPLAGWVADVYSLGQAFLLCAVVFAVTSIFAVAMLFRHKVV